jgi:peptidoglycan/xylan/chitin deacetylase (PgdA/CDA1 family)
MADAGGLYLWWVIALLAVVYITILVLGAIYIRWNFYLNSFNKSKDKKLVALTFDDGPASETALILDILKEQNVKAAFFVIGKHAAKHPAMVQRMHEEGHLVGNHSYDHGFNFDWQSARKMAVEMNKTNELIKQLIGKTPKCFRPPYGVTNPNVAKAVKATGMYSIGWSLRSFDTKAKHPKGLRKRILNKLQGGDIVLLHDSVPFTREILTDVIVKARQNGFTFARVDQLLDIDAYM